MIEPPAGFTYSSGFLSPEEADALAEHVRLLDFRRETFRGVRMRRGYAQFGHAYHTESRRTAPAPPFPDWLTELAERVAASCPPDTAFDSCILTNYPADAGIGWHTDKPVFGPVVAGVSLLAPARLLFRRAEGEGECEVCVEPGSLYVMAGPSRWDFQHSVAPVVAQRVSLTFRSVRK